MFFVGVVGLMTVLVGFAQDNRNVSSTTSDKYIISAKAGSVNYLEGKVSVRRANGVSGYLVKGDKLEIGDKVSTSADGRVEVLLNPGSFVRLDNNSEFEFITTSLNDLKLQVNRGSAIFEVFASNDFKVTVTTPNSKFYLIDTGVYRVDVNNNGAAKIEVQRGKAQIGTSSAQLLKKGKSATVNGNEVAVSNFDKGNNDSFEQWSKDRAKLIAKANDKLRRDTLSNTLLSSRSGLDCFNSFGLWVFNPRYSSYSFLPYGYSWRSPYGFGIGTSTDICNYPRYYDYWRPRYGNSGGGTSTGGGGTPTPTNPQANINRGTRNTTPPFRRMENSGNVEVRRNRGTSPDIFDRTGFPNSGRSTTNNSSGNSPTKTTTTTPSEPSPNSTTKGRND